MFVHQIFIKHQLELVIAYNVMMLVQVRFMKMFLVPPPPTEFALRVLQIVQQPNISSVIAHQFQTENVLNVQFAKQMNMKTKHANKIIILHKIEFVCLVQYV
jgi:hypothetical protein